MGQLANFGSTLWILPSGFAAHSADAETCFCHAAITEGGLPRAQSRCAAVGRGRMGLMGLSLCTAFGSRHSQALTPRRPLQVAVQRGLGAAQAAGLGALVATAAGPFSRYFIATVSLPYRYMRYLIATLSLSHFRATYTLPYRAP
jgi:hypothetical protein